MIKTRIAPTPSGYLHYGNGVNFIICFLMASIHKGSVFLRIDDLDRARFKYEYLESVFNSLDHLGLKNFIGPHNAAEFNNSFSQQNRINDYNKFLNELMQQGLLFACNCSRTNVVKSFSGSSCNGNCLNSNFTYIKGFHSLRLNTLNTGNVSWHDLYKNQVEVNIHELIPFPVMLRKDGIPSYQIASLYDDVLFKINLVIRGEDLLPSTALQLWISKILGLNWDKNVQFGHHPLVKNSSGQKLSKSAANDNTKGTLITDLSIAEFYQSVAKLFGYSPSVGNFNELLHLVQTEKQSQSSAFWPPLIGSPM